MFAMILMETLGLWGGGSISLTVAQFHIVILQHIRKSISMSGYPQGQIYRGFFFGFFTFLPSVDMDFACSVC